MTSDVFEGTNIKVIGVGGAGGNAVEHMVNSGVNSVRFIVANTDAQALSRSSAEIKLPLGRTGLGAGARPEKGQEAALAQRTEIRAALEGAHMVFVTAGMGGGTGTGAAPVVAEVAREMGILTVGVVTKPFSFEGKKRMQSAATGLNELSQHVDSLIVVLNDRLMDVLGPDADMAECFQAADDVLKHAVGGIAEIITLPGLINVDFEDVRTVMSAKGRAMMGSASAVGPERARVAAEQAVSSPLLEGVNLQSAKGVLVNITAARNGLKMREVHEVMAVIHNLVTEDEAQIIFGSVYDDSLGEELRVTVVATGLGGDEQLHAPVESTLATGTPALRPAGINPNPGIRVRGAAPEVPASLLRVRGTPGGNSTPTLDRLEAGAGAYDVPAYLRRQS